MLSTTVGNYPKVSSRPGDLNLRATLAQVDRGRVSTTELEDAFQQTTARVIREQEAAGLDVLSDGQIRWEDLVTPFAKGLDGFELAGLRRFFNNNVYYRRPILVRKPVWKGPITVAAFQRAKGLTTKPMKATLIGPVTFAVLSEDRVFNDPERFIVELAGLLHREAQALEQAGAAYLEIAEPALAFPEVGWTMALARRAVEEVTRGLRVDTMLSVYFRNLEARLPELARFPVSGLLVDVVETPTAVATLARLPRPRIIGLGCLDARTTRVEDQRTVAAALREAAGRLTGTTLYASPNCDLEFLPHDVALEKLARLAGSVREARGDRPGGGRPDGPAGGGVR